MPAPSAPQGSQAERVTVRATRRRQTIFTTIRSEGAMLPMDLLQRIGQGDANLEGLTPEAYNLLKTEKLNEAINRSWNRLLGAWAVFKAAREKLPERDLGTTLTRERWLLPLFSELGYGRLLSAKPIEANEKSYAISHGWQHTPIHLVSYKVDLDHLVRSATGGLRSSPHSLLQELLNHSNQHLWGIVSNGLRLRILRNNVSLTRQAFVEFDLEAMMNGEVYADFVLLWLLCHQSRVEAERPEACWLEKWSRTAHEQGTRALEQLRDGVEQAITALGGGFLAHTTNAALREQLRSGTLNAQDYYRQLLRLVYRLIVLFVAEDRDILFHPDAEQVARERYLRYYSTARLRRLAEQRVGTRHADLFHSLRLIMEKLGSDEGCPELGLFALDSFLFSREAIANLADCDIANHDLLDTIRSLAFTTDSRSRIRRTIDYKNMGAEELGSVYESLLELHPILHIEAAQFELGTASGNERKTTGSYYTPTSLITCLLDSALDPVLDEACTKPDAEKAILNLKICDPTCGSGHFLIAAAHRVAKRLAAIRTSEEEPAPEARRKALRDVVGHCIYGVDINPMAVELCKVSLWMEAIEPGKPLSFLEQHIQCGNSLLGTTPALLTSGIPDSAFLPIEGDDKKICSEFKKKNKLQREGNRTLFDPEGKPWERLGDLATSMAQLEEMSDDTVEAIRRKQDYYGKLVQSNDYLFGRLWADAWCAAFVWKKNNEFAYPITEELFRKIEKSPYDISNWMRDEIKRLAEQYQFFHWHLAFPDVFRVPTKGERPESEQAGWSGGFDVVLGNPPYIFGENQTQKVKALFQTIFHLAKGQYDTYWLFIERGLKLMSHNGRFGLVVPDTLLARDETQEAREFLLHGGLEYLFDCGTVFKANVSTIIFVVAKGSRASEVHCEVLDEVTVQTKQKCSKERFLSDPKHRFLTHISDEEANIFSRIENHCKPLQSFVKISRGEEIGKKEVLSQGSIPIIAGEDISRYFIQRPFRFLCAIKKDATFYESPKIVMLKTGLRCIAALDEVGYVTMQSVYNLHLTMPDLEYETLLALLNSRFVYCFVYKFFTSYKGLFPQLNQSTIQEIPVPMNITREQEALTALVKDMQGLKARLKIIKATQEEDFLRIQIKSIDNKIDRIIYMLYGLTAEDVAVIEHNMPL